MRPASQLGSAIGSYSDYWEVTGGFTARREMPGIEPVLIINLGEPVELVGADRKSMIVRAGEGFVGATHTRSAMSRSSGRQRGIHIHMPLLTMKRLIGVPLNELADHVAPLDAMGEWARSLAHEIVDARTPAERAAIVDRHLVKRFPATAEQEKAVAHAISTLAEKPDVSIEALAHDLGWSPKRLGFRVREATGVGPRLFRRLARFSRLVAKLQQNPAASWAQLALECGWFDQPHMLRDFREFAGVTPREFVARSMPNIGGLIEG